MSRDRANSRSTQPGYRIVAGKVHNEACEINVAEHCNLRCRGCSHLSPSLPKRLADPDEVYRDLAALSQCYEVEHVRLLGGEPLLHPALSAVAEAVRASGITNRIRVLTNGLLLPRTSDEFWNAVNEVHISAYPGHELSPAALERCMDRAREAGVELVVKRFDFFRESYSEVGTHNGNLTRRIYRTCQVAHVWRCHNVSQGYFFKCPQAIFLNRMLGRPLATDGIRITDDGQLTARLIAYLANDEPLAACSNCLGSVGQRYSHQQVARQGWRDHQSRPTEDMVDHGYLAALAGSPDIDNRCVTAVELKNAAAR